MKVDNLKGETLDRDRTSSFIVRFFAVIGICATLILILGAWAGYRILDELKYQNPPFAQGAISATSKTLDSLKGGITSYLNPSHD